MASRSDFFSSSSSSSDSSSSSSSSDPSSSSSEPSSASSSPASSSSSVSSAASSSSSSSSVSSNSSFSILSSLFSMAFSPSARFAAVRRRFPLVFCFRVIRISDIPALDAFEYTPRPRKDKENSTFRWRFPVHMNNFDPQPSAQAAKSSSGTSFSSSKRRPDCWFAAAWPHSVASSAAYSKIPLSAAYLSQSIQSLTAPFWPSLPV
ncbi:MAG: hypothetical protein E7046_00900 [Lentisphaerae bacterium]|nr:hypothetical protein [Lentisphaerota bacterium]